MKYIVYSKYEVKEEFICTRDQIGMQRSLESFLIFGISLFRLDKENVQGIEYKGVELKLVRG